MIRVVAIYEDATEPIVSEVAGWDEALFEASNWAQQPRLSSLSLQVLTQWWETQWRHVTPGCEVRSEADGSTWVVSRGISEVSPHEVEIYRFGRPDVRHTFTPLYDAPVHARMTQESSMRALLMTELGARLIDDGG
jgi:hypothetical protein